jgi:hypothetical protein
MLPNALADAGDLLREVAAQLRENGTSITDSDIIASLAATRELAQLVSQVQVHAVALLKRSGAFAAVGHARPESAVMSVLGIDRGAARGIVRAAENVVPQVDLQGQVLPARLPELGAAFATGTASLEQIERIGRLMETGTARRIPTYA